MNTDEDTDVFKCLVVAQTCPVILFPADSLERAEVERDFRAQWDAARSASFQTEIFDFDGLKCGEDIERVLRRVPEADEATTLIYRGWMLPANEYTRLADGLKERGWQMINDARAYEFAHHAPENYEVWRDFLPLTKWIERARFDGEKEIDFAPIYQVARSFGEGALIVKDWVKSQKHEWAQACFIPNASDEREVSRVVSRFLELTGENLTGGLVFRRFENLRAGEWRSFWLDGELLSLSPNPKGDEMPDMAPIIERAKKCPARFFSLDWAQKESGEWMMIEMGDGGVSGLAASEDEWAWYRMLKRRYDDAA